MRAMGGDGIGQGTGLPTRSIKHARFVRRAQTQEAVGPKCPRGSVMCMGSAGERDHITPNTSTWSSFTNHGHTYIKNVLL